MPRIIGIDIFLPAGGGGGGANWTGESLTPVEAFENNEKVFLFEQDASQRLTLFLKVPQSYNPGQQISMNLGMYSPATANAFRMQTTTTLIQSGTDEIEDTTDQLATPVTQANAAPANLTRILQFALTDGSGEINSVPVAAGDVLKVDLERPTDAADTDTEDTRFLPSLTEVNFG